jgi:hypothetical protein
MKFYLRVARLLVLLLLMVSGMAHAQLEDELIRFFSAGQQDGAKLTTAYLNPAISGFGYALNGAWFHTAKPHKLAGFDINIALTPVFIPKAQDRFDPMSLGLQTIVGFQNTSDPGAGAPTMLGPDDNTRYYLNYDLNGNGVVNTESNPFADEGDTFGGPQGLALRDNIKVAPVGSPMIQIGVGLIKGTDIMIRFAPEITIDPSSAKMLGFGLRHNIKQHFRGLKGLPLELSIMGGYTNIQIASDLSGLATEFPPASADSRQEATYTTDAFIGEALVSRRFGILTLFGGVGYNYISTRANINGSYTFYSSTPAAFTLTDPYAATFTNQGMRFDAGFRLNILAFFLYSNYTYQEYQAVTVGLGFTVN